jgi:hypothetical protein
VGGLEGAQKSGVAYRVMAQETTDSAQLCANLKTAGGQWVFVSIWPCIEGHRGRFAWVDGHFNLYLPHPNEIRQSRLVENRHMHFGIGSQERRRCGIATGAGGYTIANDGLIAVTLFVVTYFTVICCWPRPRWWSNRSVTISTVRVALSASCKYFARARNIPSAAPSPCDKSPARPRSGYGGRLGARYEF